ncbi:hypothetical protein E2C01_081120 [Portunus trituberculatus]|uniref:Uncharacterized protein n=1 Tax=Portunus trituberculatus TaxID=210409 RepID=A0A5B7IXV5_PORTR|nr:hypothetical protein [Portunus trituberculatus]
MWCSRHATTPSAAALPGRRTISRPESSNALVQGRKVSMRCRSESPRASAMVTNGVIPLAVTCAGRVNLEIPVMGAVHASSFRSRATFSSHYACLSKRPTTRYVFQPPLPSPSNSYDTLASSWSLFPWHDLVLFV